MINKTETLLNDTQSKSEENLQRVLENKLNYYIGMAYRSKKLFHSSSLIDKVYKNKIKLIIVNKKIDEYLQKAINNRHNKEIKIPIAYCNIEKTLNKMCSLYEIKAIGLTDIHLAKAMKELFKKEEIEYV